MNIKDRHTVEMWSFSVFKRIRWFFYGPCWKLVNFIDYPGLLVMNIITLALMVFFFFIFPQASVFEWRWNISVFRVENVSIFHQQVFSAAGVWWKKDFFSMIKSYDPSGCWAQQVLFTRYEKDSDFFFHSWDLYEEIFYMTSNCTSYSGCSKYRWYRLDINPQLIFKQILAFHWNSLKITKKNNTNVMVNYKEQKKRWNIHNFPST